MPYQTASHGIPSEQRGECPMHPARWHRDTPDLPFAAVARCAHVGGRWVVQALVSDPRAPFVVIASDGRDWQLPTSAAAARLFEARAGALRDDATDGGHGLAA